MGWIVSEGWLYTAKRQTAALRIPDDILEVIQNILLKNGVDERASEAGIIAEVRVLLGPQDSRV